MKRYVSGLFLIASILSNKADASQFIKISDQELLKKAKHIVTGTVSKITTALEEEIPFRYIEVTVNTVYKTTEDTAISEGETITIRQMGGEADGISLDIDGLPQFEENTDVFLTLKEAPNGYFIVVGCEQGKFDMVGNGELIRDTSQSIFVRKGEEGRIEFHPGSVEKTSLNQLIKKINNAPVNGITDVQE
ncbi:MAG: hypothetical protein JXA66_00260 [Oligoflexia bacterium]|nr:hypothetical protein [Oligoflexia bacterium]